MKILSVICQRNDDGCLALIQKKKKKIISMTPLQGLLCCPAPGGGDDDEAASSVVRETTTTSVLWLPSNKQDVVVVSLTEQEESVLSSDNCSTSPEDQQQNTSFDILPLVPFLSLAILSMKSSSKDSEEDNNNNNNNSKKHKPETQAAVCLPNGIPHYVEFTTTPHQQQPEDTTTCSSQVFDPTVPLRYGKNLDALLVSSALADAAQQLYQLLQHQRHCRRDTTRTTSTPRTDDADDDTTARLLHCITQHPETCQVRYPHPSPRRRRSRRQRPTMIYSPALALLCASTTDDALPLVQAAYAAYPEAVGMADRAGYLPLHYAAARQHTSVVTFLLSVYPDAVRCTVRDTARTALHLAAASASATSSTTCTTEDDATAAAEACMAALVAAHPASVHTPDAQGWTALHCWVQNPHHSSCWTVLRGIQLLTPSSSILTHGAGDRLVETPLHLAVEHPSVVTVEIVTALHTIDTRWVEQLDDGLQTCLHRAVNNTAAVPLSVIQWLLDQYPAAYHHYDDQGRRPYDLLPPAPPSTSNSNTTTTTTRDDDDDPSTRIRDCLLLHQQQQQQQQLV